MNYIIMQSSYDARLTKWRLLLWSRRQKLPFLSELITVLWLHFLGAFAKWRNAIINFVTSVCLSVCPHKYLCFHCADFHEILYLSIFRKYVEKIQVSLKFDTNNCSILELLCTLVIVARLFLLRMKSVSIRICREIHTQCSITFFTKILPFMR